MRNRVTIIILYVFCLSIIPSFIYAQGNLDQAKSKIKEINGKWENYLKDGNQQALLDLYADDAYLLAPNSKTIKGKDAIKEHYSTESSDVQKFTDVKFSTTDVLGQNDMFVEIGTYKMTMQMKNSSKPVEDEGKYVTVWRMMPDGSLKVVVDAFNTDMSMKEVQNAMNQQGKTDNEMTGGKEKK